MAQRATVNATGSTLVICDRAGGWSLSLPAGWFDRPSSQHGREIFSYDPTGMDNDGNNPPAEGVSIRLQMMQNPRGLDPAAFMHQYSGGPRVLDQRSVTLAGQPAELVAVRSLWSDAATELLWYLRSPYFLDRVVALHLVRPESPLRADAERLVSSLRFFPPTPISFIPVVTRAEAIARVMSRPELTLTRIEAKLVLRKELEAAIGRGTDFYTDPDALTWVIAYAGTGIFRSGPGALRIPGTQSAPPPPPTPQPVCLSTFVAFPADGEIGSTIGPGCDTTSSWPAWFDGLVDHGT